MKFSLVQACLLAGAVATDVLTPEALAADIHTDKLQNVLWNFNKIARDNGGNRAFGFPGYNASLDFVLERVATRFSRHFDTFVQPFTHIFASTRSIDLVGPEGEDVRVDTLQYNNPTTLPGGNTGVLVNVPIDDERGSGCYADQWEGIDVTGSIALIKRGTCAISDKLRLARNLGAVGAILIHNVPGDRITAATLSAENIGQIAPVGVVTYEQGMAWYERVEAGESLTVTLTVDAVAEERETWNIISETKEGDPNNVVMLGAHLDSVQQGPGINDDGSGSAALLEIAGAIRKYRGFPNKVRFGWWGAEEGGIAGSQYYARTLSEEDADKVRFYLNFDMIGSPSPFFHVYADTEGDRAGGQYLFDYLSEQDITPEWVPFATNSDYLGFINIGIPSSGLFTGSAFEQDPCYHISCDDIDNINWDAITVNARAAASTVATLALSLEGIPPRDRFSMNPKSKRGVARSMAKWVALAAEAEHAESCNGHAKETV
ncbi:hypothetical protein S7711_01069 [Stachybotrys chartarum IBT 7711]|uniref:Peptide hydrolase n=1 Tax=Stachybotrys chartarum (strain CBS 109288 / IBT 7711) TaxID=1280523 RepID=A0A084B4C2_STACB|nr:hypothetical protein S7711_01069 [Stachybotrys chartarum IBT 7711]KFA54340.1 hypothetical protein S40293_04824 [Stachybotrys chartarum IBT 40293]